MLALFPSDVGLSFTDKSNSLLAIEGQSFIVRGLAIRKSNQAIFGLVLGDGFEAWQTSHPSVVIYEPNELEVLFPLDGWVSLWQELATTFDYSWSIVRHTDITNPYTLYTSLLFALKLDLYARFDNKTKALIAQGFSYSGSVFSLSLPAQLKWTNLFLASATLTYPVEVTSMDEQTTLELVDAAALSAFYTSMTNTLQGHISSGAALKQQVRELENPTEANLLAIEDNR